MSTQQELYGEHHALLLDCDVTIYSDGRPEKYLTLVHRLTGITVKTSGTSQIGMQREALDELAGKLKAAIDLANLVFDE